MCLFIENLHLAEHSKTLSDIQGRVPQFPRKIHLCLLKYYLSKLLIQTNALFYSSSNQILLHNMQLIIFYWIFVFYISYFIRLKIMLRIFFVNSFFLQGISNPFCSLIHYGKITLLARKIPFEVITEYHKRICVTRAQLILLTC